MGIALNTNSRDNQDERPPGGSGLSIDALGVVLIVLVPAALITSIAAALLLVLFDERDRVQQLEHDRVLKPLAREIGVSFADVEGLVADLADGAFGTDFVRARMTNLLGTMPALATIAYEDPTGMIFRVVRGPDGAISFHSRPVPMRGDFAAFRKALEGAERRAWRAPYYSRISKSVLLEVWHPSSPQEDSGRWGVGVSSRHLSKKLAAVAPSDHSLTPFVLSGFNDVLAHPEFVRHGRSNRDVRQVAVQPNDLRDPVLPRVTAFYSNHDSDIRGSVADAPDQVHGWIEAPYTDGDGRASYLFTIRNLETNLHDHLSLGIWSQKRASLALLWQATPLHFVGGAAAVTVLFSFLSFRMLIVRPLDRLADAARAIDDNVGDGRTGADDALPDPAGFRLAPLRRLGLSLHRIGWAKSMALAYMPKQLADVLRREGGVPTAVQKDDVAIMFTDIVGFTTLAERLTGTKVAALLNEHFEILGQAVEENGGIVDKFIGDALMAFWGAPVAVENPSLAACRAAVRIAKVLEEDNRRRQHAGRSPIQVRIGIHEGAATIGNIGSKSRVNYTIVGDSVNVCQRLEGLARDVIGKGAVTVVISDTVRKSLPPEYVCKELGVASIRGRAETTKAFLLDVGRTASNIAGEHEAA